MEDVARPVTVEVEVGDDGVDLILVVDVLVELAAGHHLGQFDAEAVRPGGRPEGVTVRSAMNCWRLPSSPHSDARTAAPWATISWAYPSGRKESSPTWAVNQFRSFVTRKSRQAL